MNGSGAEKPFDHRLVRQLRRQLAVEEQHGEAVRLRPGGEQGGARLLAALRSRRGGAKGLQQCRASGHQGRTGGLEPLVPEHELEQRRTSEGEAEVAAPECVQPRFGRRLAGRLRFHLPPQPFESGCRQLGQQARKVPDGVPRRGVRHAGLPRCSAKGEAGEPVALQHRLCRRNQRRLEVAVMVGPLSLIALDGHGPFLHRDVYIVKMGADVEERVNEPVASKRHAAVLTAVLLLVALAGWLTLRQAHGGAAPNGGSAGLYVGLLAAEWGLFLYARAGLKRHGTSIARLVSARPLTARTLAIDVLLGLLLLAALIAAQYLAERLLGQGDTTLVRSVLVTRIELVPLWLALAASAGFVEELVFRGYFQRQFGAWLGSPWAGVAAQALLFGVTHGYQGGVLVLRIALLGLMFGAVALLRRSLIPGMVAHAATDMIGGLALLR
ncbi:MAG: protease family protein [Sphingomonadales bacterium]|nr:protease family protein [Sphingomonadales bacterium]